MPRREVIGVDVPLPLTMYDRMIAEWALRDEVNRRGASSATPPRWFHQSCVASVECVIEQR